MLKDVYAKDLSYKEILEALGYELSPEEVEKLCDYGGKPTAEQLKKWLEGGREITDADALLAWAYAWARKKYQPRDYRDHGSYAALMSYLVTGWYGGFGTELYEKERKIENRVFNLFFNRLVREYRKRFQDKEFLKRFIRALRVFVDAQYFGREDSIKNQNLSVIKAELRERFGVTPGRGTQWDEVLIRLLL